MKLMVSLLCLGAFALATPSLRPDLHGAQVLRAQPLREADVHYLSALIKQDTYDFWTEPRAVGKPVDIMAKRWHLPILKKTLRKAGIQYTVLVTDVETQLRLGKEDNDAALAKARGEGRVMDWTAYHEYQEIIDWLDSLPVTYPTLASVENVGTSYEGRQMKALTISTGGTGKPSIFLDAGIHAREWVAPATVTYIVNELLSNSASYQDLLNRVDIIVMPSINPDGYAYSWSSDRLWRKTRSPTNSALGCVGADPNRNWDFHWMEGGSSSNACSDIYAGAAAFSEVENRNVRDVMIKNSANLKAYLTFHSYGQYWLYPWGYTPDLPADWQELDTLAVSAVNALTAVYGKTYTIGSSTNVLYVASGGSDDWAKGVGGVKYSYTVELRDNGIFGFQLPAAQIIPTGEETLAGFLVVANFVKDTYGL